MRRALTTLHRWLGLFSALFLCVAGSTGALIAWHHELDAWLAPEFHRARSPTPALDATRVLALADALERAEPTLRVVGMPLHVTADAALPLAVLSRAGKPLAYDEVALDPASARVQGRRAHAALPPTRLNLMSFLYKLHYTLHIPASGVDLGMLFMGMVALVWVVDACIALWISFPNRKHWRRSLQFRVREGGHKLNFDVHRSGGVWTWLALLVIAFTGMAMNLRTQLVAPLVARVSHLEPTPIERLKAESKAARETQPEQAVSRNQLIESARSEAERRGWRAPLGALRYFPLLHAYRVGFFAPDDPLTDGTLGSNYLYYRADGSLVGEYVPGSGSAGEVFLQAQFPLHSGRLFGPVGRIIVSALGLAVAALSVTGIVIWARRKRTRHGQRQLRHSERARSSPPTAALDSPHGPGDI